MKTVCTAIVAFSAVGLVNAGQGPWQQCGGIGWTGEGACISGNTCTVINDYYWQCLPGTATPGTTTPGTTPTSAPPTATPGGCTVPKSGAGKVKYAGINIAGFDFGCSTDGTCNTGGAYPPLASNGGPDGVGQMQHFFNDVKFNIFRLPVGWQWLVNNNLGGSLDANNFAKYDQLVQECLNTGATCIIDIHNYARWNGQIIGQGGPTDDQFASLWSNLATKYKANDKVIFGLMNEPHDVPDINRWGQTMQAVVHQEKPKSIIFG